MFENKLFRHFVHASLNIVVRTVLYWRKSEIINPEVRHLGSRIWAVTTIDYPIYLKHVRWVQKAIYNNVDDTSRSGERDFRDLFS